MKKKWRKLAKINKTKSWFCEKINKIDKPLARLIKKNREKTQINRIRNEKGEVTIDTAEVQRIMSDYNKQPYANKVDNLEEMEKFIEKQNLQRLSQSQALKLRLWLKIFQQTKAQDQMAAQVNCIKHLEKS